MKKINWFIVLISYNLFASITSVWQHEEREIFHYAIFSLLWYLLYKADIKNKDLREMIDFLQDHKITIKNTYKEISSTTHQNEFGR